MEIGGIRKFVWMTVQYRSQAKRPGLAIYVDDYVQSCI